MRPSQDWGCDDQLNIWGSIATGSLMSVPVQTHYDNYNISRLSHILVIGPLAKSVDVQLARSLDVQLARDYCALVQPLPAKPIPLALCRRTTCHQLS